MLQRRALSESRPPGPIIQAAEHSAVPPVVYETLRSSGQPVDTQTREFMEPRFGYDFSRVRVHTDGQAAESARKVNALAYTVGNHMVFAQDQYGPRTEEGRRLIAHELTHVVQQRGLPEHSGRLGLDLDPAAENEAHQVSEQVARATNVPTSTCASRFLSPCVARDTKAQEFPGLSQGPDYVTCGAASLISALLIWDRERKDPNSPNTLLLAACNAVLVYMDNHKEDLIKGWDQISVQGTTGKTIYDETFASITMVRDAVKAPNASLDQKNYELLGLALYALHKNSSSAGMSRSQMMQLQNDLGIGATRSEAGTTFDDLMNKLTGLQPGQIAQISWYSQGNQRPDGKVPLRAHAFLVGRFQRGTWFLSDQGEKPPVELEEPDLISLKGAIRENTRIRGRGIHTGGLPVLNTGGPVIMQINPDTGVMILGDRAGVQTKAAEVIMKPGDFLAEVDASVWTSGDKIFASDFVARADSLDEAKKEMSAAGTGSGAVIVENPVGLFHVFKTDLVSDTNVNETKIDAGDSAGGKLAGRKYYNAWLQLRSKTKTGAFFKVY